MLFLLFQLDRDRYALDVRRIVEVLPLVGLKQIPHAPRGVAGVCNYRGTPVPVIDLSELTLGRPASARFSTRLVLVDYPAGTLGMRLLGLIAEKATETLSREETDFVPSGVASEGAPYLGPVTTDARGLVQRIEVAQLLPPSVREALYQVPAPPP